MKSIDGDLKNSVFSFIPNTAETSFYGMIKVWNYYIKINKLKWF